MARKKDHDSKMAEWDLSDLAQELSDLEVALLLCLVARGHPLLETIDDSIDDVAKELSLVFLSSPKYLMLRLLISEK